MPNRPEEILPDLFFMQRGYLNANHFAYRADRPVLIDTGYRGHWDATEAILQGLGLALERTALIINTHTHCDHVGGNHAIQVQSGCDVALHPRGYAFMRYRDARSPWWSYYHQAAEFFDPTHVLEDGQEIQVGPHVFTVIHTPGHAADGLVLYHRRARMLISSDTLWARDFPVMTVAVEGDAAVATMLASLEKIASLAVDRVYPGHGDAFQDFAGAHQRAVARLERFTADPALVGWDLVKKIIVYTIMMKGRIPRAGFFDHLMATTWFPDTVERYFDGQARAVYDEIMAEFERRDIVRRDGRCWITTVRP